METGRRGRTAFPGPRLRVWPERLHPGGVPVIFPQFGKEGPLPRHGFARRMEWAFVEAEEGDTGVTATFQRGDNQATRRLWPHAFLTRL